MKRKLGVALLVMASFSLRANETRLVGTTAEPTNGIQLNAWYAVPSGATNSANLYLQGFKLLKVMEAYNRWPELPLFGRGTWPPPDSPLSPNVRTSLSEFISENREAIAYFQRGNMHPHCRYPIRLATDCSMPHLRDLGFACRLMLLAAVHAADSGRTNEAGAYLADAFKLAWSLSQEPAAVSQAQRGRLWKDCFLALGWMLNGRVAVGESSQISSVLRSQIKNDCEGASFHRAIIGERIFFTEFFLKLSIEDWQKTFPARGPKEEHDQVLWRLRTTPVAAEKKFYSEASFQIEAAWRKPYPERLKGVQIYSEKLADAKALELTRSKEALGGIFPDFDCYLVNEPVMIAQSQMALIAIALESHRSDRGSYPQFLSSLTPAYLAAVPTDPFSGRPFRYRREAGGYELYSAGRDFLKHIRRNQDTRPYLEVASKSLAIKVRN